MRVDPPSHPPPTALAKSMAAALHAFADSIGTGRISVDGYKLTQDLTSCEGLVWLEIKGKILG